MKVLITGGGGFIGSHLADRLFDEGHEVLVIDNYATGRRDNLTERDGLTIVEDTIDDAAAVDGAFESFAPDFVVHAAASYKDPDAWARGRPHQRARHRQRRARRAGRRRRAPPLLPDRALLRHAARGAAGHARPPDPAGLELRDLQDGGRAVHRAGRPRLRVVPAGQRLRPAQHLRAAADVLPAPDRGQAVLRDGHAARLHLRRRPRRRRHAGRRRRHGPAATTTCPPGTDFSIKELFDATIEALPTPARRGRRGAPAGEDDAYTILLDPSRTEQDFGWSPSTPLEEGVRTRDRVLPRARHRADLHAPEGAGE